MSPTLARPARARFQEAAAPPPAPALPADARLYAWGARALYIGPALNLSAHRNAVAVLALGLDGLFETAETPGDPESAWTVRRSLLIRPDALHHLRADGGRMAFLYVDPLSRDLAQLSAGYDETALIGLVRALADGTTAWPDARRELTLRLGVGPTAADPRLRAALDALHADPSARIPLDRLAAQAGLSASRFRHLFRAATGVTVRRYRVWTAMGAAVRAVARGERLTEAALAAGFSSSAHFSAAFREMFGLEPSRLAKGRLALTGGPL